MAGGTGDRGSFSWPTDVAIAVDDLAVLLRISRGAVRNVGHYALQTACAAWLRQDDGWSVWVSPRSAGYRGVWAQAARQGAVGGLQDWGDAIDVDHLLPRSWARRLGNVSYIRLFPVYGEVNRSAGAGPEKAAVAAGTLPAPVNGVWYAKALQMQKIVGLKP